MIEEELALDVADGRAACYRGRLYVGAVVTVPATNYQALLERSPILIFPPPNEFSAMQYLTGGIGADVLTKRTVFRTFPQPADCPEKIRIHARDKTITVDVFRVGELAPSSLTAVATFTASEQGAPRVAERGGGGSVPFKDIPIHEDTSTGYSTVGFEDAFNDAVAKLPPAQPHNPDAWVTVDVTSSGAQYGGFAGIRRYFVSVSRVMFK